MQPTRSEETANIISPRNIDKASGPFSIPNKILISLEKIIDQLPLLHSYLKLPRYFPFSDRALNYLVAIIVLSVVYQMLKKNFLSIVYVIGTIASMIVFYSM